jgi:hypothetical protein
MSVHSVQSSHAATETQAVSQVQSTQKQANLVSTLSQDKVTISAEAQAKQTVASIGAVQNKGGK